MSYRVLIVDDEPTICWAFESMLSHEGHEVKVVSSAESALEVVRDFQPHAIVLDVRLPGMDGISAMKELDARVPGVPIIIMTAFGDLQTAVDSIGKGAFEYLAKPFGIEEGIEVVRRALQTHGLQVVRVDPEIPPTELVGKSPKMQALFRQIALVADRDIPVLITGESGTGKDLVAQAIHSNGRWKEGPFVPICVPALSPTLVESELFGHTKGSFTGADKARVGLLALAQDGTAFLDELGDIPLSTQVKLLRAVETKTIAPVGAGRTFATKFRLVAATNRNLEEMLVAGEFREDLYYRLNVFRIEVPPLRDRGEDIAALAAHFLRDVDKAQSLEMSEAAYEELRKRPWLGNVRELRNAVEHAAILARSGQVLPEHFPPPMHITAGTATRTESLSDVVSEWATERAATIDDEGSLYEELIAEVERPLFDAVMQLTQNNRQAAARILGMHRQTLREKMKRYE